LFNHLTITKMISVRKQWVKLNVFLSSRWLSDLEKLALREDVSRGPAIETSVRRGANARAAVGLRSQSKIAAQKSPEGRRGRVGTHPVFEHVIWRSKLSLKGASRGFLRVTRSALRNPRLMKKRHFFRFYKIL